MNESELTPNQRRSQALAGRSRSIEERAHIRAGMRGVAQNSAGWAAAVAEERAQIEREERILAALAQRKGPLVAPEIANHRTQLAQLIDDATTTTTVYHLSHQRLVELIERRNIQPETWALLEEWLGLT